LIQRGGDGFAVFLAYPTPVDVRHPGRENRQLAPLRFLVVSLPMELVPPSGRELQVEMPGRTRGVGFGGFMR